ncbi:MAG: hypothetical protein IT372_07260 [Polyangiaceae bacterium]|nr:hypothetical protein [Polyangiaceae bacterium]
MAQHHSLRALLALLGLVFAGCGGTQPRQAGEENNFEVTPTGGPSAEAPSSEGSSASEDQGGLNPDQKKQMEIALRRGGEKAANCAEVVADAPAGEGEVKVVFDGQKGRITDVAVGPPFAGTPAEACIKRAFVGEIVLPFEGDPLEVPYTVKLPPKKGAAPPPDKKK